MKRSVLISLVLFIISFMCFAEEVYPSEGIYPGAFRNPDGITLKEGDKVNIGVSVNCTVTNLSSVVTIGFSDSIPSDFAFSSIIPDSNILTSLTLKDSNKDGKGDNLEDNVYVFYQIKSPTALVVSLGLKDLLEGKETKEKLGWSVSWTSSDESGQSTSISYTEDSVKEVNVDKIFEKEVSSIGYTAAGYEKLEISTANYREKSVDTYEGYLYVNIVSKGT